MKKLMIAAAAAGALLASGAQAARVTNLDSVAHVVTFEFAGSVSEQTVEPSRTIYFQRTDGIISLKGGTPAKGSVTSDGMLGGVIGAARTSQIPAGPMDDFTIWPGGEMHLQRRIKGGGGEN